MAVSSPRRLRHGGGAAPVPHWRGDEAACRPPYRLGRYAAQRGRTGEKPPTSLAAAFIEAVQSGVHAMAGVCGFVIFFLVLLRLAEGTLGSLPPLAAGLLELTNGILRLTPDRRGFITAAGLLGWGGLSVHGQTAAVLSGSGISLRRCLPAKALQGALSAVLAAAVWRWVL